MMRTKLICVVALLAALYVLSGCQPGQAPDPTSLSTVGESLPAGPSPSQPDAQTDTISPTGTPDPSETEQGSQVPYLEQVIWADQPIFSGPGYDNRLEGTVEYATVYTIVEESLDEEGNLWGRLKSGAGWIDLTDNRSEARRLMPVSVSYASAGMMKSGGYLHYEGGTSGYACHVAFRFRETATDVRLYSTDFGEKLTLREELCRYSTVSPDTPLVADLEFPGDFTTYVIRFTAADGTEMSYCVSESLRNGTVSLAPYHP